MHLVTIKSHLKPHWRQQECSSRSGMDRICKRQKQKMDCEMGCITNLFLIYKCKGWWDLQGGQLVIKPPVPPFEDPILVSNELCRLSLWYWKVAPDGWKPLEGKRGGREEMTLESCVVLWCRTPDLFPALSLQCWKTLDGLDFASPSVKQR